MDRSGTTSEKVPHLVFGDDDVLPPIFGRRDGGEVRHRRHQLKLLYCVIKRRNTDPSGTRKWCQRGRNSTPRMGMLFLAGLLQFSHPYFSNALKQPSQPNFGSLGNGKIPFSGWWIQLFLFSPLFGEDSHFD